jgi:hypothetical protein
MKYTLKLRAPRLLDRKEAWACLTANLALPGAGSLAAGRKIGYPQLALAFLATALTVVSTIRMIIWALPNWTRITQPSDADPLDTLLDVLRHARWPLAGIALFFIAILWAGATSLKILAAAPKQAAPPRIG